MNRYGLYNVNIDVLESSQEKSADIAKAISFAWKNVDMLECIENGSMKLRFHGIGYLGMGETELEFSERICQTIKSANRSDCKIKIKLSYLDSDDSSNDQENQEYLF